MVEPGPRPPPRSDRHFAGFTEQIRGRRQPPATFTDILQVFHLAFAVMFGMGHLFAAIGAGSHFLNGGTQMALFRGHCPTGFTGIYFFSHNSSSQRCGLPKHKVQKPLVNGRILSNFIA
jgi:hypothetical protein